MQKFDIAVIGAGPGGYPAAIRASQLGASVALIEKERLGGTCLNWGCIPTKTLIASSDFFRRMQHSGRLGLQADAVSFDYAAMSKRKDEVVATLRSGIATLLKGNAIEVFEGVGSFLDRNRIMVRSDSKEETIGAAKTIIATGSASLMPRFLPKSDRVADSRAFLNLDALPATMIVLGGGVIGCELACMAAQLGVKVTIVEMLEDILVILDPDVRAELRKRMEKDLAIRILVGKPLTGIKAQDGSVSGMFGKERPQADLLLAAVGRKPVTDNLDLAKAGLSVNERGFIPVDQCCRTKVASIFAIGDVTGGPQFAYAATNQGLVAAENAQMGTRKTFETLVPTCIFTSPEVGAVGLTECQARELGIAYKTGKFAFAGLGKALAAGETAGFVKWIAASDTGQLLGAHAIGPHATELIAEATAAVRAELTAVELSHTVHCHPTFAEAWMEAAHAIRGECIHAPPKKRNGR